MKYAVTRLPNQNHSQSQVDDLGLDLIIFTCKRGHNQSCDGLQPPMSASISVLGE